MSLLLLISDVWTCNKYQFYSLWFDLTGAKTHDRPHSMQLVSCPCDNIISSKSVFDICLTEFGADLTTVLPVLFKYCCKYCYSDSRKL
jgi:hypothetical protein